MPTLLNFDPRDLVIVDHIKPDHLERVFPRKPVVKILIAVDGTISFTGRFGLGRVIRLIRQNVDSYVRFEVDLARMGNRGSSLIVDNNAGEMEPKYRNFRYSSENNGDRVLEEYDQLWLFGIRPGNARNDDQITDHPIAPTQEDLEVLTDWMNAGGGVLAMGDHDALGASMCSQIPRVRGMRRWTLAQDVPSQGGRDRHDTNQPANASQDPEFQDPPSMIPNSAESDDVPQEVEWKRYRIRAPLRFMRRYRPHPVMCAGELGPINVFPDHPHEGWVYDDADVDLSLSYQRGRESVLDFEEKNGQRPTPEVIAWANTKGDPPLNHQKGETPPRRFGMVGVYDGDSIDYGRVIVDSTWHHWFDMNLEGWPEDSEDEDYLKIIRYFRNCAVWLSREGQRRSMLRYTTWFTILEALTFEEFDQSRPVLQLGEVGVDVIGRKANSCLKDEWIYALVPIDVREWFDLPEWRDDRPLWAIPDKRVVLESVLGGIIQSYIEVRDDMMERLEDGGIEKMEPEELNKRLDEALQKGAETGLKTLQETIHLNAEMVMKMKSVENFKPVMKSSWLD